MIHDDTKAHGLCLTLAAPRAGIGTSLARMLPGTWRSVVHLHRRAGFAATWAELQRDLRDGPDRSIDRLLSSTARAEGVPADFAAVADKLVERAAKDIGRLKAWWVYRMVAGPDPLGERLALSGTTTSPRARQKSGRGSVGRTKSSASSAVPYGELLTRVVHDPALLLWLDAPENTRGRPNENLAAS